MRPLLDHLWRHSSYASRFTKDFSFATLCFIHDCPPTESSRRLYFAAALRSHAARHDSARLGSLHGEAKIPALQSDGRMPPLLTGQRAIFRVSWCLPD